MTRLLEGNVGTQMARVAPQPMGWSASVASMRSLGVARSRAGNATPSTAAPLVVAPVAYHARSSRRGRRANRKPRPSPDDRVESAVTVRVRRDCPGDTRVGMLGDGAGGVLGQWDTSKVAPMRRSREDPALWEWVLAVPVGATLQFKLVTVDPGDAVVRWSQGSAIRVDVPRGCAGVDVDVDWPVPRGPRVRSSETGFSETGSPDAAGAPLSVRLTAVVEKPLHEYRVETGGAWLAYGAVTRNDDTEDTAESETEPSRRLDDTKEDVSSVANERSDSDNRGALRRRPRAFPEPSSLRTSAPPPPESTSIPARVVVDALDAVDLDAEGAAERDTAGHFVRADVSADEAFLSADESDDESDPGASDDASDEARDDANDLTTSRETLEARRAAGYVVGSHLDNMTGGKRTELVVNAADSARRGIRVGVVEDGRLVETWYEDSAGPGEGMRVGDVYLGVVAKVIGGMQGVLVDVTGKGPPYSLMQKGVDEPALAWREADAGYERELELERMEKADSEKPDAARAENEGDEGRGSARLDGTSPGAPSVLPNQSPEPEGTLASEARLARLERKAAAAPSARAPAGAEQTPGPRASA